MNLIHPNTDPMLVKTITETEYSSVICGYFNKEFPNLKITNGQLLEILAEILLGTKETRFGPLPVPEHQVVIRDIIRKAVEANKPIPVLVPFGGIKANKTGEIDVAEVQAIKRLMTLYEHVQRHYNPGLYFNVRIEDVNAVWLYGDDSRAEIQTYSYALKTLIEILGDDRGIHAVRESDLMTEAEYFRIAQHIQPILFDYIISSEGDSSRLGQGVMFEALVELGWKGVIPYEQRDFYVDRYQRLYPGITRNEALRYLSVYLAGSKARYDLKANAAPNFGFGAIQLNYSQPVPGAPTNMFNNTLYYRTLPMSEARSHMPAWRAKGYLKISESGEV
jgi:hypothetical protein